MPVASNLEEQAESAEKSGQTEKASEYLRRAAVVYRISRFPYIDYTNKGDAKDIKWYAFNRQKQVYLKAASFWKPTITEVAVPHTHRSSLDGESIPVYIRTPTEAAAGSPVPVVLLMTGLDGYRPDNSQRTQEIISRGWAAVVFEIPGTADCPADAADPDSPDRLLSSVLDYVSGRPDMNASKVVVWGLSAGGFYAIRAAHTHRARLAGCIAHGPGTHHFLNPEWLSKVNDHEYPFMLTPAWAKKYGYDNDADFIKHAQKKFSLVETGIVDQASCRLLLLNGVMDGVTPIEDCMVLFNHGSSPKEGRFFEGLPHMGYPNSLPVSYDWLENVLGNQEDLKN